MKGLRVLITVAMVVAFATAAMAATVTIQGSMTGSYTLSSMSVDSQGNITINVNGGQSSPPPPNCTPSSAAVSPLSISLSKAVGGNSSYQNVTIQDNCGNNLTYSNATVTNGSSWISVPTSGTGLMTLTFNTSGLSKGQYSGNVQFVPSMGSTQNISVNLTVTDAASCVNLPVGTYVDVSINANDLIQYCLVLPNTATGSISSVSVGMNSRDWATNQDIILSNVAAPTWDTYNQYVKTSIQQYGYALNRNFSSPPWYKISPDNNEQLIIWTDPAKTKSGQVYYLTIFNLSPMQGMFKISWSAN